MQRKILIVLACLVYVVQLNSQATGNNVTAIGNNVLNGGNNLYHPNPVTHPAPNMHPTTNQYLIEATVLYHANAESYIAVFGVSEEADNAASANSSINDRIASFRQNLYQIGVGEEDVFVDLITQTRVYDYQMVDATTAKEKMTGIELKKNVHVSFTQMDMLEEMMLAAARENIYDIVKIDYVVKNMDEIYHEMQTSALATINRKKELYMTLEEKKYAGNPFIMKFEKGAVQPLHSYKNYVAHETNLMNFRPGLKSKANLVKLSARRMKTFYFDPLPAEQFDSVINAYSVEPTVQLTLKLQVRYDVL